MMDPARAASDPALRVLLVDDDALTLELHRSFLHRIGGVEIVGECDGARAAIDLLRDRSEDIDLILLDVTMPDGTGLEVLRYLRARGMSADVITVTGVRDAAVVREMVALGAVQYLIKPFSFPVFRERIEQFRTYHRQASEARGAATQVEVDALFAALRPATRTPLPKGLADGTLAPVMRLLRAGGGWSASEVSERLGLSRVVARRYLEYLSSAGRVERTPRYGAKGRPQTEYRWRGGAAQ